MDDNKMKIVIEGTPDQIAEVMRKLSAKEAQPTVVPMPYPVYPQQPVYPGWPNPYIGDWTLEWLNPTTTGTTADLKGVILNPRSTTTIEFSGKNLGDVASGCVPMTKDQWSSCWPT